MSLSYVLLAVLFLINPIVGAIYNLDEADYKRMPPVFHLDDYSNCLKQENWVYCTITYNAVSDEPTALFTMMEEYSKHNKTHYNHTSSLTYGMCVSQNCKNAATNKKSATKHNLEVCLNESIWKNYNLKTEITAFSCNTFKGSEIPIDITDIIVGLIVVSFLVFNIVGSLYDVCTSTGEIGNKYLLSFSVKRNWKKLCGPYEGTEDQIDGFRGVNGIRALSLFYVLMGHTILPFASAADNTQDLEKLHYVTWCYIILNGSFIIQMYLLLSSFLFMYKTQQIAERTKVTYKWIPRGLIMRWLRLAPSYALTLGIVATWLRRAGTGPLWDISMLKSSDACRKNWWRHILFIHNYGYISECMGHTWYVAADMQLYVIGLLVCVLTKGRTRKVTLVLLYVIGAITPAVTTYLFDLEAVLLVTPTAARKFFMGNPTFEELHVRAHSNIPAMVLGLLLGELVYKWRADKAMVEKLQRSKIYRCIFWITVPLAAGVITSGKYWYRDAPRDPLLLRALFCLVAKPIFTLLCGIFLTGVVLKIEDVYRRFLEWEGWTGLSRLSYCAYLVHLPLSRLCYGTRTDLIRVSDLNIVATFVINSSLTLLVAMPLWLLFEAPSSQIINLLIAPTRKRKSGIEHDTENSKTKYN